MPELPPSRDTLSEAQFAALVGELKTDPARRGLLADLLKEDDPVYAQRGTAATIRMRGWVLLAFEHLGLPEPALIYVLEELDNGRDAYLIAAAAHALRCATTPNPAMADFLVRAIINVRDHDDIVCLQHYGGYSVSEPGTTAVREILASLRWLGPDAHAVLPELDALRLNPAGQFSKLMLGELESVIEAVRGSAPPAGSQENDCCAFLSELGFFRLWRRAGEDAAPIRAAVFEDQDGARIGFRDFFHGRPAVVVFFYSRCDNPRKCSLTIAKLARVQKLLADRGLESRIRTAAITYDPEYDLPDRMRGYALSRGVHLDSNHRMLRATGGMSALRAHFRLGVNFIESLVNRHRVEVYILDAAGEVAASFARIQWDECEVVEQAVKLLEDFASPRGRSIARETLGLALPIVTAFLPKCPMCWAGYLSAFGIAGLQGAPYFRWLLPLFASLMLINLGSLWLRGVRRGSLLGFYLAACGAVSIVVLGMGLDVPYAAPAGVVLTFAGSLLNALSAETSPASISILGNSATLR